MEYIDKALTVWNYITSYINNVPAESWYVLGGLVGASIGTFVTVNVIKNHHYKKTAEKLAKQFVALNLVFWSTVMTAATFIVTNGDAAALLPFLGQHAVQVVGIATVLYNLGANKLYVAIRDKLQSWVNSTKKPSFASTLPDLQPEVPVATYAVQPSPASSFGNEANNRPKPSADLIQL